MKAYCLHVRTGSEKKFVIALKKELDSIGVEYLDIVYPTRVMNQKRKGLWHRVEQPLLPGYLFFFLSDEQDFPLHLIRQERDTYSILRYSDGTFELRNGDYSYAQWVYDHNGKIKPSTVAYKEGQFVKVVEGPLESFQGKILKLDRHHRRAIVMMTFAGAERKVNLSVDFIDVQ
ncbi:MAG: transcription termination/antitermination NusG family protein [Sphaerochaetaceae bacterium]|jgi:transcriptional antiterminator NusG